MLRLARSLGQHLGVDVREWEVGDRVAAGLVQQDHVLAVGDPLTGELNAHPAAQAFGVQESFGEWFGGEEAADRAAAERALLPGQSHQKFLPNVEI